MSLNIISDKRNNIRAFVLAEVLTASLISIFIFLGAWSIYHMTWRWWHEIVPRIETERIARIALSSVIEGSIDSTAGNDGASYRRRNGISWAVYEPEISSSVGVDDKIEFGLEEEKEDFGDYPTVHNLRAFYLGTDPTTGLKVVYYQNNASEVQQIRSTRGITSLKFEKFKDINNKIYLRVTAIVDKDIIGTRDTSYLIKVEYIDYTYLRNVR